MLSFKSCLRNSSRDLFYQAPLNVFFLTPFFQVIRCRSRLHLRLLPFPMRPTDRKRKAIVREPSGGPALDDDLLDNYQGLPQAEKRAGSARPNNDGGHSRQDPQTGQFVKLTRVGQTGGAEGGTEDGAGEGGEGGADRGGGGLEGGADGAPVVVPMAKRVKRDAEKANKVEKRHRNRAELRPRRTSEFLSGFPLGKEHAQRMLELDRAGRVDMLAQAPCRCCGGRDNVVLGDHADVFSVTVYGKNGTFIVPVAPNWCRGCGRVSFPDAGSAACYAGQALASRALSQWFTLELLSALDPLVFHGSAFKVLASYAGCHHHHLITAWFEHKFTSAPLRDLQLLGVTGIDTGPLAHNPGLADLRYSLGPEPLREGPAHAAWHARLERLHIIPKMCTDGTRTMDLLSGAGRASRNIPPTTSSHFSHERQQIFTSSVASQPEGADLGATICGDRNYIAARDRAVHGKKQSEGVIGAVDEDGLPIPGTFLAQGPVHECFLGFDTALITIIKKLLETNARVYVFLDHGCKYGAHLTAVLGAELAARVTVVLPWMHAELHILSCRLSHSGMYVNGIGYVVGENSEQLWNQMKPLAKNLRYMAWANHLDLMNFLLQFITERKVAGLFKAQQKNTKDMAAKKLVFKRQLDETVTAVLTADGTPRPSDAIWATAMAYLKDQSKQLTAIEIAPDAGQLAQPENGLLVSYSSSRLRLHLTKAPLFCDERRSFDFLLGGGGNLTLQAALLQRSVSVMEEGESGKTLVSEGWLTSTGSHKEWDELTSHLTFFETLAGMKDKEVLVLRERIVFNVLEVKTTKLLLLRRSYNDKTRQKLQRGQARVIKLIEADLHSLKYWDVWTARGGFSSVPARPSTADVDAVLEEKFPWLSAGAAGRRSVVAVLLPSFRVTLAKFRCAYVPRWVNCEY